MISSTMNRQHYNKQQQGMKNLQPKKDDQVKPKHENQTPTKTPGDANQEQKESKTPQNVNNVNKQQGQRGGGGGGSNHNNQDRFQHHNRGPNSQNRGGQNRPPRHQHFEKGDKGSQDSNRVKNEPNSESSGDPKKFTGRCRLFVGNLAPEMTEEEFKQLFQPFGDVSEVYVNPSRSFGFIRLDYRHNAEAAKVALDGKTQNGRTLRVRFATHGAALKVTNLHPYVSNELLHDAFCQFGELERAIVIVDDRGKSTGEGIVEFVRKPGAQQALRRINEGVFLLGSSPRPVIVEPLEQKDEEDGMPEKFINKNDQYKKEREQEPRFAHPGTFEYEFGLRWRQIEELEKERHDLVKKETEEARLKLEEEMQSALYEYQAEQIRQDLMRQQEELRRLEEHRQQDMIRRHQELEMRQRQQEHLRKEDEQRRQQMFMMAHRLDGSGPWGPSGHDDLMSKGGMRDTQGPRSGRENSAPLPPPPAPPVGMGIDRNRQNQMQGGNMGPGFAGNLGEGKMGGGPNIDNPNKGGGGAGNMPAMNQNQMQRASRFDQPPVGNSEGQFGPKSANMGGPGGPMGGSPGNMFGNQGMGGGPGMRGERSEEGMNRRREPGPRENFGDLKRMRRF